MRETFPSLVQTYSSCVHFLPNNCAEDRRLKGGMHLNLYVSSPNRGEVSIHKYPLLKEYEMEKPWQKIFH